MNAEGCGHISRGCQFMVKVNTAAEGLSIEGDNGLVEFDWPKEVNKAGGTINGDGVEGRT